MSKPLMLAAVLVAAVPALADNPVSWTIDEQLDRGEASSSWTSPTAIDLDQMVWQYAFEITKVTGTAVITVDITDELPPELRMGSGYTRNLPAVLLDDAFNDPASGTSADIFVEVDSAGFGQADFTNIMLGSIDLGFGAVPLSRINVTSVITVTGFGFGDYNLSGAVTAEDYQVWRADFGMSGDLFSDGNGDGAVNAADYTVWRDHLPPAAAVSASSVPEPASALLLIPALLMLVRRPRQTAR
ncbi:hypothetical protein Pla175_47370 [Pirellulimonas nuda]|uniref:Dockerin domain-containing protein n=1 Tax=Pirellulimonas nuda TaxID=2528009 RepID=A0A518DIM6_9BACT|nr:hypothetical protein [Pirellulimonas nuda]QDU91316.1 hypothetical protein Pla175_47370 [Pirellulimonas nuda]